MATCRRLPVTACSVREATCRRESSPGEPPSTHKVAPWPQPGRPAMAVNVAGSCRRRRLHERRHPRAGRYRTEVPRSPRAMISGNASMRMRYTVQGPRSGDHSAPAADTSAIAACHCGTPVQSSRLVRVRTSMSDAANTVGATWPRPAGRPSIALRMVTANERRGRRHRRHKLPLSGRRCHCATPTWKLRPDRAA